MPNVNDKGIYSIYGTLTFTQDKALYDWKSSLMDSSITRMQQYKTLYVLQNRHWS